MGPTTSKLVAFSGRRLIQCGFIVWRAVSCSCCVSCCGHFCKAFAIAWLAVLRFQSLRRLVQEKDGCSNPKTHDQTHDSSFCSIESAYNFIGFFSHCVAVSFYAFENPSLVLPTSSSGLSKSLLVLSTSSKWHFWVSNRIPFSPAILDILQDPVQSIWVCFPCERNVCLCL